MPLLRRAKPATAVVAARWYLLFVPVQALAGLPFYPLRGRNDFFVWNALRITPTLPWIVVLTAAWLVEWRSPSRLAYCYLAGLASLFFPIAFVAKRRIPGSFAPKARKFNPLLRYGLLCMMTTVPQLLNFRLDQMLMAGLLRPVDLGLYVAAVAWSGAVNPLLSAVGWALFPKVASEPSREARTRAFAKASRLAALLAAILGLLLLVSTPWGMILLFGRKFLPALKATFILIPAAAVAGLNTVLEEGLRGLGHPASVMRGEFAGLLITVVALAIMLRPLGIIGASFASLLGYSTVTLALITQSRWLTGASVRTLLFPSRSEIYSGLCQLRSTARQAVSLQS